MMIRRIESPEELQECVQALREAFGTVALELGLTEANAPTNPAFVTVESLKEFLRRPAELYGRFVGGRIVGCVAIERSGEAADTFYIERLGVRPADRHKGYGAELLGIALLTIQARGGREASVGIIRDNERLRHWYLEQGFRVTSYRRFAHLPFEVCFMARAVGGAGAV
jgi:ribosomal protein S18 acetylase RimI-like enzyme